ncbi:MAG TPA: hypothetical protein VNZ22_00815 [Bacillota bacterium]|nr:hypothetical protein [Bacillota bacterium]
MNGREIGLCQAGALGEEANRIGCQELLMNLFGAVMGQFEAREIEAQAEVIGADPFLWSGWGYLSGNKAPAEQDPDPQQFGYVGLVHAVLAAAGGGGWLAVTEVGGVLVALGPEQALPTQTMARRFTVRIRFDFIGLRSRVARRTR